MSYSSVTRVVAILAAGFVLSFVGVSYVWSSASRASLIGLTRMITGPQLEHSPPENVARPGQRILMPTLARQGEFRNTNVPERFILTVFDLTCPVAADSVRFWNRAHEKLLREGIAYVIAACAESAEALAADGNFTGLDAPLHYAGPCGDIGESLALNAERIVHYAIADHAIIQDAWTGKPIYEFVEDDVIAQMIHALARD